MFLIQGDQENIEASLLTQAIESEVQTKNQIVNRLGHLFFRATKIPFFSCAKICQIWLSDQVINSSKYQIQKSFISSLFYYIFVLSLSINNRIKQTNKNRIKQSNKHQNYQSLIFENFNALQTYSIFFQTITQKHVKTKLRQLLSLFVNNILFEIFCKIQMKLSRQIDQSSNKASKEAFNQREIPVNALQAQSVCNNFSIIQFEKSFEQNLESYFQSKQPKKYSSRKQINKTNNSLDLLIKSMISKIEDKIFQGQKLKFNQQARDFEVFSLDTSKNVQVEVNLRTVNKVKLQNQNLHSKILELKRENKELINTVRILSQAYEQSKTHFQQQIQQILQKKIQNEQKERFQKSNPYLLKLPSNETLISHQILTVKNLSNKDEKQNNYMTKSQDLQRYTVRTQQVKSAKGTSSSYSRKEIQHFQNKVSRISDQNKRIRECLNEANVKLKKSERINEELTKQIENLLQQKSKLQQTNLKRKNMIEKLMQTIEKKYQISSTLKNG